MRTTSLLVFTVAFAAACGQRSESDRPAALAAADNATADTVIVYKSPTCGCCRDWVDNMRENGFTVIAHDTLDLDPIKRQLGVPAGQESCHTATVKGYTIEGHVPADLIRKLIDEKSKWAGLAVPGMPMGSPGMDGPVKQAYDVVAFDRAGKTEVYAKR
jgi:hypothetical protein